MEVQLYVYDLTRGMARSMSQQFLGIQIDAVYHTSLVFNNIEYFFGAGVQTCYPGSTHHGRPMEIIPMGLTELPMDTIMEYLQSLKQIYTAESYDLFAHNCNNFTNDFSMFLVGKGIPDHITSLPKRVLDTPFGQMLKPQIDASMRSITQAEVPPQNVPAATSSQSQVVNKRSVSRAPGSVASERYGSVINVSSLSAFEKHLTTAADTCASVFFTSATCAPCRIAYPMFDNLAGEHPQALFLKVDIDSAHDVASRYAIRATPTFMTFAKGVKLEEWSGADPQLLKSNVERLIERTYPPHPHSRKKVSTLQFGSMKPTTYAKIPPLDKLMAKLGTTASHPDIASLQRFVETRTTEPKDATLPNMRSISTTFKSEILTLPVEILFAAVDLLRCAVIDPRVSGFFAEEQSPALTIPVILKHVNSLDNCPHSLRLVTIHLACNVFSSPLYVKKLLQPGNEAMPLLIRLITSSLLDASHPTTRVAAASLSFNLATANYRLRREEARESIAESDQVELAASLIERMSSEDNADANKGMVLALGYLIYFAPQDGDILDLCKAMDTRAILEDLKTDRAVAKEVAKLLE